MVTMKRLHHSGFKNSCQVDHSVLLESLAQLWEQKELCDCVLVTADQRSFHAQRLVLAAASHYFKVLFLGTGQHMLNSISQGHDGLYTIHLDEVDSQGLELVLQALYQQNFQVGHLSHCRLFHSVDTAAETSCPADL